METGRGGGGLNVGRDEMLKQAPGSSGVLKEELKVKGLGFFLLFVRALL